MVRRVLELTLCWCMAWSRFLSSLCRSSLSCLRSGTFSTLVLFRRLTIGFSRWGIRIFLTFPPQGQITIRHVVVQHNWDATIRGGYTFFGSLKPTCPTAMLPSFLRLDHGVYMTVILSFLLPCRLSNRNRTPAIGE